MQRSLTVPYFAAIEGASHGTCVVRLAGTLPIDWAPRLDDLFYLKDVSLVTE